MSNDNNASDYQNPEKDRDTPTSLLSNDSDQTRVSKSSPPSKRSDSADGERIIGMWQLGRLLGEGGMGTVYEARHLLLDRKVAIKLLRPNLINEGKSRLRFQEEAMAVGALNHPNIVDVFDCNVTAEGELYLVMELLVGKSLADLIKSKGKLSVARAVPIFMQICDGLDQAHKSGTIHRDLKPSNIILVDTNIKDLVKIVDFGIAKRLSTESEYDLQRLTGTGELVGSPLYMSPEQCRGTTPDARSDIYSLGCLMYETLAGSPPFKGNTFFETLNMHVESPVPRFSSSSPQELGTIESIVLKCLAKFPGDRYQSLSELHDDLKTHFKHLIPAPPKPSITLPFGLTVRRLVTALSALLILAAASTAIFYVYEFFEPVTRLPDSNKGMPFEIWELAHTGAIDLEQEKKDDGFFTYALNKRKDMDEGAKVNALAARRHEQGVRILETGHAREALDFLTKAVELKLTQSQDAAELDLESQEWRADQARCYADIGKTATAYDIFKETVPSISKKRPGQPELWADSSFSYAQVCMVKAKRSRSLAERDLFIKEARDMYTGLISALLDSQQRTPRENTKRRTWAKANCLLADTYRIFGTSDAQALKFGKSYFPMRSKIRRLRESGRSAAELNRAKKDIRQFMDSSGYNHDPFDKANDLYKLVIRTADDQALKRVNKQIKEPRTKPLTFTDRAMLARSMWCRASLLRKYGSAVNAVNDLEEAVQHARKALSQSPINEQKALRRLLILALRDYSDALWSKDQWQSLQLKFQAARLLASSDSK